VYPIGDDIVRCDSIGGSETAVIEIFDSDNVGRDAYKATFLRSLQMPPF